eukprot:SAG22_NODE_7402_length_743_cov_0.989130_1_plen_195_part_10
MLLELEWKAECHAAGLREAEEQERAELVVDVKGGVGGVKIRGKRGRRGGPQSGGGTFGRPEDPLQPTRHLYLANTGPRFGLAAADLQTELNRRFAAAAGGDGSAPAVLKVTVVQPKLPFVYASFATVALAVAAKKGLDRREPGSAPLVGRQLTAEFAVELLPVVALPAAGTALATAADRLRQLHAAMAAAAEEDE